ncbi:(2Fe-2S)-binding protein [Thalassospira marina]|uniref:Sarcosine oxidase subunit alpha n=1 Tax=Thalassospira marina TaxID=2048283 RepID=A0A2N3KTR5_9PROT|nr:(2Fe-2S)-binding protein [Thalassospira marina]AUG55974.1 sarcosine oxidase subunit alpha [Thalassospira marina]PKR53948.1 sarcosine oxidase subunit alpha [Thalassospira marina]
MFRSVTARWKEQADMIVYVNGVETPAWNGETVASILLRVPDIGRQTPVSGETRLPYCQMGVCFECLAVVDGVPSVQGCLTPLKNGMRIDRQRGRREVSQ